MESVQEDDRDMFVVVGTAFCAPDTPYHGSSLDKVDDDDDSPGNVSDDDDSPDNVDDDDGIPDNVEDNHEGPGNLDNDDEGPGNDEGDDEGPRNIDDEVAIPDNIEDDNASRGNMGEVDVPQTEGGMAWVGTVASKQEVQPPGASIDPVQSNIVNHQNEAVASIALVQSNIVSHQNEAVASIALVQSNIVSHQNEAIASIDLVQSNIVNHQVEAIARAQSCDAASQDVGDDGDSCLVAYGASDDNDVVEPLDLREGLNSAAVTSSLSCAPLQNITITQLARRNTGDTPPLQDMTDAHLASPNTVDNSTVATDLSHDKQSNTGLCAVTGEAASSGLPTTTDQAMSGLQVQTCDLQQVSSLCPVPCKEDGDLACICPALSPASESAEVKWKMGSIMMKTELLSPAPDVTATSKSMDSNSANFGDPKKLESGEGVNVQPTVVKQEAVDYSNLALQYLVHHANHHSLKSSASQSTTTLSPPLTNTMTTRTRQRLGRSVEADRPPPAHVPAPRKQRSHTHTGSRSCVCHVCNAVLSAPASLKTHMLIHSGDKPYNCLMCTATFRHQSTLKRHMCIHTGEKKFVCDICRSPFARKTELTQHQRSHSTVRPYTCKVCGSSYKHPKDLSQHLRAHVRNMPTLSKDLGSGGPSQKRARLTRSSAAKKRKSEMDRGHNELNCDMCGAGYNNLTDLTQHVVLKHAGAVNATSTSHPPPPHDASCACPVCGVRLQNPSLLALHHQKTHLSRGSKDQTQDSAHDCSICGSHFRTASAVSKHIKKQHWFSSLESDQLGESEESFACSICSMEYERQISLTQHMKKSHGINLLPCNKCGSSFVRMTDWTQHLKLCS